MLYFHLFVLITVVLGVVIGEQISNAITTWRINRRTLKLAVPHIDNGLYERVHALEGLARQLGWVRDPNGYNTWAQVGKPKSTKGAF